MNNFRRVLSLLVLGPLLACSNTNDPAEASAPAEVSSPAASGTRLQRSESAQQRLLNLEFFADGRGMMMVPELIDVYDAVNRSRMFRSALNELLERRLGFVIKADGSVSGLFKKPHAGFNLGVLGCATCHSGKAAGRFVPGLGNKNIDVFQIGRSVEPIQQLFASLRLPTKSIHRSKEYGAAREFALNFAKKINVEEIGNLTQGVVPVSIIQTWFYDVAGLEYPRDMNRGATKVPALWGYGTKREKGKYADGFGHLDAWLVSIELTAGQKPETVRGYLEKVHEAQEIFADLLPPPYPFPQQCSDSMPGKAIFQGTCEKCHGSYERDAEGFPVYQEPKFVPINVVQTDRDRTDAITEEFKTLVRASPLSDVMHHNDYGKGYIAPRLEGVWARFPYLHNASVPSLRALLTEPTDRPEFFSLKDAGEKRRFDRKNGGLTVPEKDTPEYKEMEKELNADRRLEIEAFEEIELSEKDGVLEKIDVLEEVEQRVEDSESLANAEKGLAEMKKRLRPSRDLYDTRQVGQSNLGHPFGTTLSDADKDALIAYLNCL